MRGQDLHRGLITHGFIYSHAVNYYQNIKKQLQISGHPV